MIIAGEKFIFDGTFDTPITVADSWVMPKNKLGDGNGEAKLYVGSRDKMEAFFGEIGFTATCFVLRQDLQAYMHAIKAEYLMPSQDYRGKDEMRLLWKERMEKINALSDDIVFFTLREQSHLVGARGYVNSSDRIYRLIREISLPLVSYISVMRLDYNGQLMFYLKLFTDFEEIEKRKAYIENYGVFKKAEEENLIGVYEEEVEKKKPSVRYGREGQDEYRKKLLEECPFCPITMINEESLLIASHIKPWAVSDSRERIDPNNGFIFSPLYDKLFDRGYITFSNDKRVSISNWLSRQVKERIGIKENQLFQFLPMNDERAHYLDYHRRTVFKG
ncbi:HNH endonuclease [Prevotella sp. lc2012]|uniref:HNH endonuclease n=1 Tax=Prevotella sp. lc2012 TaxID=1761886 RepID=UPI000897C5A0|nr:HNH endonuclease [Prevotella sp. lc2012]SED97348.1 HNH endonuclease [Prevotella sp. lc2012]